MAKQELQYASETLLREIVGTDAQRQVFYDKLSNQVKDKHRKPERALQRAVNSMLSDAAALSLVEHGEISRRQMSYSSHIGQIGSYITVRAALTAEQLLAQTDSTPTQAQARDVTQKIVRHTTGMAGLDARAEKHSLRTLSTGMLHGPLSNIMPRIRQEVLDTLAYTGVRTPLPFHGAAFEVDDLFAVTPAHDLHPKTSDEHCPVFGTVSDDGRPMLHAFTATIGDVAVEHIFPRSIDIMD